MEKLRNIFLITSVLLFLAGCRKSKSTPEVTPPVSTSMDIVLKKINDKIISTASIQLEGNAAVLQLSFNAKLDRSSVPGSIVWANSSTSSNVPVSVSFTSGDSVLIIQPESPLVFLNLYNIIISTTLKSIGTASLASSFSLSLRTGIDVRDKFPRISDNALLDTVQKATFRYFWDYGHPVSGLARDKTNTSDLDDCSIGGTGFGILCIPIAANRNFITRGEGLARMQKIVGFLKLKANPFMEHFHTGSMGFPGT